MSKVIIVGGGLGGMSTAWQVIFNGGSVLVIDKSPFCGGNSVKATSGINGAGTYVQHGKNVRDSSEAFFKDTAKSAQQGAGTPLAKVLTYKSGAAVEWLIEKFGLDLSLLSRLGGHSFPRTHRGKTRFPGMTITYALMERLEELEKQTDGKRARVLNNCTVTKLVTDSSGAVVGVEYTDKKGKTFKEQGPVVIATGGYGADFSANSLLQKYRPDVCHLSTTNGAHCTGDGIKMSQAIGGGVVDMKYVQVHPTGLVDPQEPNAKTKFLAAEALRGCGGLLLNGKGERFCDELGLRDYVSGRINANGKIVWLVLNTAASKEIHWHCEHYKGRGLMRKMTGRELAKDIGVSYDKLDATFSEYNQQSKTKSCPHGKRFYPNLPVEASDTFYVARVTPLVHYTMGGVHIDTDSAILNAQTKKPIPGLWAAGEVCGAIHGKNRLGGSSLLDCVVFGRVAGDSAARYLLEKLSAGGGNGGGNGPVNITVENGQVKVTVGIGSGASSSSSAEEKGAPAEDAAPAAAPTKQYTAEEVAKHNTKDDCWVIVNGKVLDCTSFLESHPGGVRAIVMYAGRDASKEFNMLHKPDVVEKYAPEVIIGDFVGAAPNSTAGKVHKVGEGIRSQL